MLFCTEKEDNFFTEALQRWSALTKGVKKDEDEEDRGRKEQRGQTSRLLFRSSVFPWKGSVSPLEGDDQLS